MPKRGGKSGRGGKQGGKGRGGGHVGERRELIYAMDGQVYAEVKKLLGSCRFELYCSDGVTRLGHVRGAMQKRVWIKKGDTVLACPRDFQDGKADVVHVFTADETRVLQAKGQIARPRTHDDDEKEDNDVVVFSSEFEEAGCLDKVGDVDIDNI